MTGKPHAIDGWTARPGDEPRCKPRRPRGCALRGDAFTCGRCHIGRNGSAFGVPGCGSACV